MDDYRGICCLPPIAKVFERILNKQVVKYFETNNLFCDNQHDNQHVPTQKINN